MAQIVLSDVRKSFGPTEVIKGVDIEIEDGELIVIVGPSGCGKSTLLRMVAGLETVTGGEIRIAGKRVNELEPVDRDIAMVFQNYALYPHMSVFDNMAYGLKIARTPKAEIADRVAEAARMLQLEPYLQRKPRELSGGQRQRVAMGRAIVRKPQAFLFDEPLSNLDAKLRVQMRLEIKSLQRKLGVTALYVTHDQVEAMTLADRMIVMNDGVAEQIGRPLDVYRDPQTRFVAGFIGSPPMNFFSPDALPGAHSVYELGVRPEHASACAAGEGRISGEIAFTEALGAETLVHLDIGQDTLFTLRLTDAGFDATPGRQIGVTWESEALLGFDAQGRRLRS